MEDIAASLQFLEQIDETRSEKFFQKIEEIITVTNPKLLVQPTLGSLLAIATAFKEFGIGKIAFWRKIA